MYIEKFKLDGKVAIVTGGNRGLGIAMTEALADAGADISLVSRNDAPELKERIEKMGRKFIHIRADLRDCSVVDEVVSTTVNKLGRVDILVNNAGMIRRNTALDYTEEEWDEVLNLNLKTMFFLSQRVAREFIKQGDGGKIISTASVVSFQGGINNAPYSASKTAVTGVTKTMCNEWAKHNICVNAIAPGYMRTDMTDEIFNNNERNKLISARIPMGRWGKPEDVGGAVLFLASSASDYITGVTIPVDGGWLAF